MFRWISIFVATTPPSPHARGDVPIQDPCHTKSIYFSPRPWGCSDDQSEKMDEQKLLPTPVGMFRGARRAGRRSPASPHARGDVPAVEDARCRLSGFSPPTWGYSAGENRRQDARALLPTPVGMFRRPDSRQCHEGPSPHARGDVPPAVEWVRGQIRFSPRPWGCSEATRPRLCGRSLLPTPVGMFRRSRGRSPSARTSPHARGDVPMNADQAVWNATFSPRPWGCSVRANATEGAGGLLPTPVGMFRDDEHRLGRRAPSPHARGDVPMLATSDDLASSFSPRPWGCSAVILAVLRRDGLLSTPVGMFRTSR